MANLERIQKFSDQFNENINDNLFVKKITNFDCDTKFSVIAAKKVPTKYGDTFILLTHDCLLWSNKSIKDYINNHKFLMTDDIYYSLDDIMFEFIINDFFFFKDNKCSHVTISNNIANMKDICDDD